MVSGRSDLARLRFAISDTRCRPDQRVGLTIRGRKPFGHDDTRLCMQERRAKSRDTGGWPTTL